METVQTKGRQDVALYVSALELERPNEMFEVVRAKGPVEAEVVKEGEEQSFLSDKSILSFVADVSAQNRQDILNSTLLAQLAANKRTPIENNMKEWYKAYIDVLGNIGWVTQNVEINEYETRDNLFEVENVIVDILSASFGAGYITLIKKLWTP